MPAKAVAILLCLLPLVVHAQEPDIRAQLAPGRFTTLSSELAARLARVAAREGERFAEGDVLITLDCAIQKAQLERARALAGAAEKVLTANRRLIELNSAGQLEAVAAAAEAAKARGEVAVMTATLDKCAVKAPFPGVVAEQKARAEQFVQPGQPILEILDDSRLEVAFILPSRLLTGLAVGQPFTVTVDETGRGYPGVVRRIKPRVDPVSQSVEVIGEIAGHFPELAAGMSGRLTLAPR
ncbi:MAG: efflux RND transporter periplasmic adaptor subunit [Alphaproteobacteria bacterium]|nr:efflux RND transporter periplasmic adaptor subunit [Alphaproteobacteria bacterium]